jgi:hypothetical protein
LPDRKRNGLRELSKAGSEVLAVGSLLRRFGEPWGDCTALGETTDAYTNNHWFAGEMKATTGIEPV